MAWAAIGAGIGQAAGDIWKNYQNNKNLNWQERMAATAYQRSTKDMIAAGLNPMLLSSNAPASAPSASATQSVGDGIGSAIGTAASVANTRKQTEIQDLQGDLIEAQKQKTQEETINAIKDGNIKTQQLDNMKADVIATLSDSRAKDAAAGLSSAQALKTAIDRTLAEIGIPVAKAHAAASGFIPYRAAAEASSAQSRAQSDIYSLPKQRNEAAAQESWWMKNVAPYLPSAGATVSTAKEAAKFAITKGKK